MQVQLAWPWTGPNGKKYKKGDVVDVADHVGRKLKRTGYAREPDPAKKTPAENLPPGDTATGDNAGKGRQKGAGK